MTNEHDGYSFSKAKMQEKKKRAILHAAKMPLAAAIGGAVGFAMGGVVLAAVLAVVGSGAVAVLGNHSKMGDGLAYLSLTVLALSLLIDIAGLNILPHPHHGA